MTEFVAGLPAGAHPADIVAGPDGNLWFTISAAVVNPFTCDNSGSDSIGRISTDGTITVFDTGLTPLANPAGITVGNDGALWFAESGYLCGGGTIGGNGVGRITTDGTITEFSTGFPASGGPNAIALGSDGRLWVTQLFDESISAMTTAGDVTTYALPSAQFAAGITPGPDGALWFTIDRSTAAIGRMSTDGTATFFTNGLESTAIPVGITTGPDGKLWAVDTQSDQAALYQVTTAGAIKAVDTGFANASLWGITAGADETLWFTGETGNGGLLGRATFQAPPPSPTPQPVPVTPAFTG